MVQEVVDVIADGTPERIGALSYLVPRGMRVEAGDAVRVPFGRSERVGLVIGPGNRAVATRPILEVYGRRARAGELAAMSELARRHFCPIQQIAVRVAPRSGRGAAPLEADEITIDDATQVRLRELERLEAPPRGRYLLRGPTADPAVIAAAEATRLASSVEHGQVIVLCPTVSLVSEVRSHFLAGAGRVDSRAEVGAWRGLVEGTLRIAIGTRSAALYSADKLAGIVVVEDNHPGHVEDRQPRTHARDVARLRTKAARVPLSIIGAHPTPAALTSVVVVPIATKAWPRVRVLDRAQWPPSEQLVPPNLTKLLNKARAEGHTPVIVTERKQSIRRCARCGELRDDNLLCARCGSEQVRTSGYDANRLVELLGDDIRAVDAAGLADIHDAGLVVIFDIDAARKIPTLIPEEHAAWQIVAGAQAAGQDGLLVVLTREPDATLLNELCKGRNQVAVAKRAWAYAKTQGYPPFGRLIQLQVGTPGAPRLRGWPGRILGPRRRGNDWEYLVQIDDDQLETLREPLARLRRRGKVRITVS